MYGRLRIMMANIFDSRIGKWKSSEKGISVGLLFAKLLDLSEVNVVLLVAHLVLLVDGLHHVAHLIYVLRIEVEGSAEVLEGRLHLPELLVDLADANEHWRFLRQLLLQVQQELECLLLLVHSQEHLRLLVLVEDIAWI